MLLVAVIIWVIVDSTGPHLIKSGLERFLVWVGNHPVEGCLAFAAVYAVTTVLFIPGALLTVGGAFVYGKAFGLARGVLLCGLAVFCGASVGAILAFLLGRYLLRADAQRAVIQRFPVSRAVDSALQHDGLKIMLLLRLSPLVPFTALNYVMSVTSISLRSYVLALVGMVPAVAAYTFLGASAGELSGVASSSSSKAGALHIVIYVVGAVTLLAAVALISWYARRELKRAGVDNNGT